MSSESMYASREVPAESLTCVEFAVSAESLAFSFKAISYLELLVCLPYAGAAFLEPYHTSLPLE